jgi:hypothetical protein
LLASLGPAAAIAPGKKTIASVEGILFECPGDMEGTCRLTAYDMEKGMRTNVETVFMTEGSFIINSQKYSLSKQGTLNADVQSSGNGINMQDVLAIQKYVLAIITVLPVNN